MLCQTGCSFIAFQCDISASGRDSYSSGSLIGKRGVYPDGPNPSNT